MIYSKLIAEKLRNMADELEEEYQGYMESSPYHDKKIDFHKKLILSYGVKNHVPLSLDMVNNVRMQGNWICLELLGDDHNEGYEYAITIEDLTNDMIRKCYEKEVFDETIDSLRKAIEALEAHKKGILK